MHVNICMYRMCYVRVYTDRYHNPVYVCVNKLCVFIHITAYCTSILFTIIYPRSMYNNACCSVAGWLR